MNGYNKRWAKKGKLYYEEVDGAVSHRGDDGGKIERTVNII